MYRTPPSSIKGKHRHSRNVTYNPNRYTFILTLFSRYYIQPGDFRLKTPSVMKQILPNKLRLLYQRRDCPDLNDPECAQPDPPKADFPNGWGGFADAMHIDFKLPSEHLIDGKRYDGEMQIYHLHPERRRFAVQVALIKATMTGYNYYFEDMLQSFENQYTLDRDQCIQSLRRHRQLMTEIEVDKTNAANGRDWNDYILKHATVTDSNRIQRSMSVNQTRQMQTAPPIGVWNPHHEMMVPSIHFWRYDGSMTDPPCGEFVSWFISDKAMEVSFEQLDRMKRVLFTHISKDCEQTSVHFEQSVARPVQATAERPVWHCTSADFGPDEYVPATS
jgi:carbonic anhydrase